MAFADDTASFHKDDSHSQIQNNVQRDANALGGGFVRALLL